MTRFEQAAASEPPLPLVGGSAAAVAARLALARAASSRVPALIVAEAGCRPDAVARALHAESRSAAPFVLVDCSVDDPGAVERRLFGAAPHRSVASDVEAVGPDCALLAASAGTLFLEGIDELPAASQRRLARVLRDGEVHVSHAPEPLPVPFRLVASTSRDLQVEAREGRFRTDLLKRLSVCVITVPPLRQRSADIPAVFERLLAERGAMSVTMTTPATTVLTSLPWTRNIDELSELVDLLTPAPGKSIRQEEILKHLPLSGTLGRIGLTSSLREARRQFERDYIAAVLERHGWSMRDAARTLGIERANLYRKTRQLGIARAARDGSMVQG